MELRLLPVLDWCIVTFSFSTVSCTVEGLTSIHERTLAGRPGSLRIVSSHLIAISLSTKIAVMSSSSFSSASLCSSCNFFFYCIIQLRRKISCSVSLAPLSFPSDPPPCNSLRCRVCSEVVISSSSLRHRVYLRPVGTSPSLVSNVCAARSF